MAKGFTRFTREGIKHLRYEVWLALSSDGSVSLTKNPPGLAPNERRMQLRIEVPASVFDTPELKATVSMNGQPQEVIPAEIEADVARALESAGMAVNVSVTESEIALAPSTPLLSVVL